VAPSCGKFQVSSFQFQAREFGATNSANGSVRKGARASCPYLRMGGCKRRKNWHFGRITDQGGDGPFGLLEIRSRGDRLDAPGQCRSPPASAAIPTVSSTTLRLDIPIAASATNGLAPAIARRNEVMSAPRVTIRALMRRGWSQPGENDEAIHGGEWKPGFKLRRYPPLDDPACSVSCFSSGKELPGNPPSDRDSDDDQRNNPCEPPPESDATSVPIRLPYSGIFSLTPGCFVWRTYEFESFVEHETRWLMSAYA